MNIDIVIIGLNVESTLKQCIESVLNAHYSQGKLFIYYVDGGSSDRSVDIAKAFSNIQVIELNVHHPTPGLGRNRGWKVGHAPLIQFLDGDMQLDPNWFEKAIEMTKRKEVAAVRGLTQELHPTRSIYNWFAQQEWNGPSGECEAFGGDVLIKREALNRTVGYNEELVVGEDPELSLRIRVLGLKIIQLNLSMTLHDLNMTHFSQYWKRSYRTGYGFAAVTGLHPDSTFWKRDMVRIALRGGLTILFFLASLFWNWLLLFPMLIILFYPRLFRVAKLSKSKGLNPQEARIYAWHCSFVVIPQFFGTLRYYLGAIFQAPMKNQAIRIVSSKLTRDNKDFPSFFC